MAFTTWNPSDIVNASLSNANLTLTNVSIGGGARAIDRQIVGKFYWEATLTIGGASDGIGFANLGAVVGNSGWLNTVLLAQNGLVYVNGTNVTGGPSFGTIANGTVIGIAIDLDNQLIWFRLGAAGNWNNNAAYAPGGAGGVNFRSIAGNGVPLYPYGFVWAGGQQYTANFGATAFTGAVPSGYTSGWVSGVVPPLNAVVTQAAGEVWGTQAATGSEQGIITQVGIEMWASASALIPSQGIITQVGVEMWAPVVPDIPPVTMKPYAMILA